MSAHLPSRGATLHCMSGGHECSSRVIASGVLTCMAEHVGLTAAAWHAPTTLTVQHGSGGLQHCTAPHGHPACRHHLSFTGWSPQP